MVRVDSRSGPAEFGAVDTSGDPGALIGILDAARAIPGLSAAKRGRVKQLALGRAHAVLEVGCGAGTDVAQMARCVPPGAQEGGVDASEAMIAEARRRAASLGSRSRCAPPTPPACPTRMEHSTRAGRTPFSSMFVTRGWW